MVMMVMLKLHNLFSDTMEMAQSELINRLPHKFHILSSQIHLLNSIGHGRILEIVCTTECKYMPCIPAGEFGEVYKAHLTNRHSVVTRIVAVKTLRGNVKYWYSTSIGVCYISNLLASVLPI